MKSARVTSNKSRARALIAESQNLITASRDLHTRAEKLKAESAQLVGASKRLCTHFHSIRQEQRNRVNHEKSGIPVDTQRMIIGRQPAPV